MNHPMKRMIKKFRPAVFIADGIMALGFGLYSWFCPLDTFGTILAIPETGAPVFMALLSSLSLFYVITGCTCMIGSRVLSPAGNWIAGLMLIRHTLEGSMKLLDIGKAWLIGNPYPDLIIHSVFILAYLLVLTLGFKSRQEL